MQLTQPKQYQLVYYASLKLSKVERNYPTTEHETLRMIYNATKFQHDLLGRKISFHRRSFSIGIPGV